MLFLIVSCNNGLFHVISGYFNLIFPGFDQSKNFNFDTGFYKKNQYVLPRKMRPLNKDHVFRITIIIEQTFPTLFQ